MEPRVLFFRVGVFSESFFVSQPFAAPVDDFPAIGESRAFEQPQHGLVVEVGVDAKGFDAAFLCECLHTVQEFRRHAAAPFPVGDRYACLLYTSPSPRD